MNILRSVGVAVLLGWGGSASALMISDINLEEFDFDITTYNPVGGSGTGASTAAGTSNGIGWSIGPTSLWSGRTVTNGTFSFNDLPNATDNLHPGNNFTITFDSMVSSLLVALGNDNTSDSINFGLTPGDVKDVTISGTQLVLNDIRGGLALFNNVNSLTVSHTNNNGINDGFDLAFHAFPRIGHDPDPRDVPEPSTLVLMALGLLLAARRAKCNTV